MMIVDETIQKLTELRLMTMVQTFRQMLDSPEHQQLSFEDKFAMLVDREWIERDNRRNARRIKEAKLPTAARIEEIIIDPARGLDKSVILSLGRCGWVKAKQNIIIHGATGVGKSFIGACFAQAACTHGYRSLYVRVPRLVHQLAIARADGTYVPELARMARFDVLVLDDFLSAPMKDSEKRDLLEVLEDRYDHKSTVITSQLPPKTWHESLADPTIADAICDRLVHNAHDIWLKGPSIRKRKGLQSKNPETKN
jgi:DNA replication protein DnaC